MITLESARVLNWHALGDSGIYPLKNTFLTGINGSGKSTILDAIKTVITVDTNHFNEAASDTTNKRNLKSYVRCFDPNANDFRRKDRVYSYIVLQMYDTEKDEHFVIGLFSDSKSKDRPIDKTWFYAKDTKIEDMDLIEIRDGKKFVTHINQVCLSGGNKFKFYYTDKDAKKNFNNILGFEVMKGEEETLNYDRFGDLIRKSMAFKMSTVKDINSFAKNYLLPDHVFNVDELCGLVEQLKDASKEMEILQAKLSVLTDIRNADEKYNEIRDKIEVREIITSLANRDNIKKKIEEKEKLLNDNEINISIANNELKEIKASIEECNERLMEINNSGYNDFLQRNKNLEKVIEELKNEVASFGRKVLNFEELVDMINDNKFDNVSADILKTYNDFSKTKEEVVKEFTILTNVVKAIINTLKTDRIKLEDRCEDVLNKMNKLQREMDALNRNQVTAPEAAQRLKKAIQNAFKENDRPDTSKYLYELIDIDKDWADAVEALMGNTRFAIIVDADDYALAAEVAKNCKEIYGATVVDTLSFINSDIPLNENSVASLFVSNNFYAKEYIKYLYNKIWQTEDCTKIKNPNNSYLDKNLMRYSRRSLSRLKPVKTIVGEETRKKRLEECIKEFELYNIEYNSVKSKIKSIETVVKQWENKCYTFGDAEAISENIAYIYLLKSKKKEIDKLNMDYRNDNVHKSYEEIKKQRDSLDNEVAIINQKIGRYDEIKSNLSNDITLLKNALNESDDKLKEVQISNVELFDIAKTQYDNSQKDSRRSINSITESSIKELEKLKKDLAYTNTEIQRYQRIFVTEYFADFECEGHETMDGFNQYYNEIQCNDLPKIQKELKESQTKTQDNIRKNFVCEMKDGILGAGSFVRGLNKILREIKFNDGKYYQIKIKANPEREAEYNMIMSEDNVREENGQIGFEGDRERFYVEHSDTINGIVEKIAECRGNDEELKKYTDYKNYCVFEVLVYDIETKQSSKLDKLIQYDSGGENQFPYYVLMGAALTQCFNVHNRRGDISDSNSLRIMLVDECFDKMDSNNAKRLIDFFKEKLNIQLILSAPTDKFNSIGIHMDNVVYMESEGGNRRLLYMSKTEFKEKLEKEFFQEAG